jgi:hypothetical protein
MFVMSQRAVSIMSFKTQLSLFPVNAIFQDGTFFVIFIIFLVIKIYEEARFSGISG